MNLELSEQQLKLLKEIIETYVSNENTDKTTIAILNQLLSKIYSL